MRKLLIPAILLIVWGCSGPEVVVPPIDLKTAEPKAEEPKKSEELFEPIKKLQKPQISEKTAVAPTQAQKVVAPAQAPAPKPLPPKLAEEKKPMVQRTQQKARTEKEAKNQAKELLAVLEKRKLEVKPSDNKEETADKASRSALIEKYEKLLDLPGTKEDRKPEILNRLAEISYQEEESNLRHSYESGTDMGIAPGDRYPKTIGYYQKLTEKYPNSPQALNAFYNLGYLLSEEGMLIPAAKAYNEVLKRDPKSQYASEIHMRLAEADFTIGLYKNAIVNYKLAIEDGKVEYIDKARYKLGWSQYKLDDFPTAVKTFSLILDNPASNLENLSAETIDIMSKCFVEWGGVDGVTAYLKDRPAAKTYGDKLLRKLGDLYFKAARYKDSAIAYERCMELYPLSNLAMEAEDGIINSYISLRDPESANARRWLWASKYAPGTPWSGANQPLAGQRDILLERGLRLAALYRHNRAQLGEGSQALALEIYAKYMELYGMTTPDGYDTAYSYAQALKEAGRFADSAALYQKVAAYDGVTAHKEDASYRAIDALNSLRKEKPEFFDDYLKAHEYYVERNPDSKLVPEILFSLGELNFEVERFPKSREAYVIVVDKYPGHKLAVEAVERVSRCYFREGDFANSEAWARRAIKLNPPQEIRDRALNLISFSLFKQAENAEAEKRHQDAVNFFFKLVDEFPEGETAQVSLYRAGENLRALGKEEEAATVYRRLAENYKTSKYAESALSISSEILSALGDWNGVSKNFENLYRLNPKDEDSPNNLFKAAVASQKAKDWPKAKELFIEFNKEFQGDYRRAQVSYRLAKILEEEGDKVQAASYYLLSWQTPAEGDERLYRAKSAMALAEKALDDFKKVELKGDLEKALTEKEAMHDISLGHLADASSLPYFETISASLYYAGESYESMKTAILDSERPEGMTDEEKEEYQILLEEKAFPLEDQAIGYYKQATEAGRKAVKFNDWIEKSYARLEAIQPWAFKRSEQASPAWFAQDYPGKGWER